MKRFLDLALAITAGVVFFPVMIVTAFLILLLLGWPIFFTQQRPGLNAKPFYIIKFRTMYNIRDEQGNQLADSERLPAFGQLLRSTSLDELPGLWNVIKGDMSLVGPRPLLMDYLPLYSFDQAKRHLVKPGLTGWAQINGRNAISWEDRLALDAWYVENSSIWLDMKIIFITIKKTIMREGISAEGEATMSKFTGNRS